MKSNVENSRLAVLRDLNILDTTPEGPFDTVVGLVADLFDSPICAISLVGANRQWFKASTGLYASETPRDVAFCDHTIRGEGCFVVSDARLDVRFASNPLVTGGPQIRFYAGASIMTMGYAIGALCIIDSSPRANFSKSDEYRLRGFASLVSEFFTIRQEGWPASSQYHYID